MNIETTSTTDATSIRDELLESTKTPQGCNGNSSNGECLSSEEQGCEDTIASRIVFDSPCKKGFRKVKNNICRKVYKK